MEETIGVVVSETGDGKWFHMQFFNLRNGIYVLNKNLGEFDILKQDVVQQIFEGKEFHVLKNRNSTKELLKIGIKNDMDLPVAEIKIHVTKGTAI